MGNRAPSTLLRALASTRPMTKRQTRRMRLSRLVPINISPTLWLYAERGGLVVVAQIFGPADQSGTKPYLQTDSFKVPWGRVRQALRYAPPKKVKRK